MPRRTLLYWGILGSIAVLCGVLAVVQYRWTGELARAEQTRLRNTLQSALNVMSLDFNSELTAACVGLQPSPEEIQSEGREQAYVQRWEQWRATNGRENFFRTFALAIPKAGDVELRTLDPQSATFQPSSWPESWQPLHQFLIERLSPHGPAPGPIR